MGIVDIDTATEGMIIDEIVNDQGTVLLKKGTALTENLIEKLKSLGIAQVYTLTAESNDRQDRISSAELPELEELEKRFSDVRGNAIMEEVMAAAKEYTEEKRRRR